MNSTSPPESLASSSTGPHQGGKTWQAGTLVYTSGGLVALFLWLLLGDFAWSMRERSVGPMAGWYLNHLEVPNLLFGLLTASFPAFVGLILGPIISVRSDRHRGPRGRRIPFLLATTPLAALGMIGLALTPPLARWVHSHFPEQNEMVVAVICFGVFWAVFEVASIASQAVFGGLINDVVPAPLLGRFYGLFRAVSLIDGMIFNFWIMGKVPDHFTLILIVIGVFYGTAFMWVCFQVREGEYPAPTVQEPGNITAGFLRETAQYFRECFGSKYYVTVFVMIMTAGLTFAPVNIFGLPYARSLGVNMDVYGKSLALTYLISLCLAFLLGWLADKFHPLRMAIVMLMAYATMNIAAFFLVRDTTSFLVAWVLHGVISGAYFTSAASLGPRLFPHSKFAQYTSAAGICTSIGNMGLAPVVGLIVDSTGTDYRYTFATAGGLAVTAFLFAVAVFAQFRKLGGPRSYVAPQIE